MRQRPITAFAVAFLPLLVGLSVHAHSGSSPEAALEALFAQQSDTPHWLNIDEAQMQALVPACEQASGQAGAAPHASMSMAQQLQLSGCVSTMQQALGWLEDGAFAACPAEGISKERVDACSSAVSTFLLQHEQNFDAEEQIVAALALMKDLCGPTTWCAPMPSTTGGPDA